MDGSSLSGPIERQQWIARLQAHVVDPSWEPRIHGFDVHSDLARNYSATEIALLALTGTAPDAATGRALEVALSFLAPVSIGEAPTHATVLARVCGARTAGLVAVAATALAEQARTMFDEHEPVMARLVIGSLNGMAAKYAPRDDGERDATQRLRNALGSFCARVPAIGYDLRLQTAIIAVLLACGLRTREQLEVMITTARLPFACAEALAWKPGDLRAYPMDLPHFVYEAVPA